MTAANDGRAERLAPWIRELPLSDQVHLTGTTLVLEEIRLRRGDSLPHPFDETKLREASTPREAVTEARALAHAYEGASPHAGSDGVDEHWRIFAMSLAFAEAIESRLPDQF